MTGTDWRGWKITDEQAEAIRSGDIQARNCFYMNNLERLRKMAYNYARKNPRCFGLAEDMIQGLYVDLSVFDSAYHTPVVNGRGLSLFVYWSFRCAPYGGLLYLTENNPKRLCGGGDLYLDPKTLSLDKPFGKGDNRHQDDDNARNLGDVIPDPVSLETEIEEKTAVDLTENCKNIVSDILSPRLQEYFAYYLDGYATSVIGEKMGVNLDGIGSYGTNMRKILRKNQALILDRLLNLDIDVFRYLDNPDYQKPAERVYKLSPEQRAKAAARRRASYARKKAARAMV